LNVVLTVLIFTCAWQPDCCNTDSERSNVVLRCSSTCVEVRFNPINSDLKVKNNPPQSGRSSFLLCCFSQCFSSFVCRSPLLSVISRTLWRSRSSPCIAQRRGRHEACGCGSDSEGLSEHPLHQGIKNQGMCLDVMPLPKHAQHEVGGVALN
jgi:hypothetical protein